MSAGSAERSRGRRGGRHAAAYPRAGRASYGGVLAVGEFRAIFIANIVSMLGTVIAAVALTVLVYEQTRSAALAAAVMALSFLPYLAGGLLLGGLAERLPARRALVGCDLASALLTGCMVIPGVPVPGLLALLFGCGLLAPAYQGVRSAVLPDILPPGPGYILGRSLMRLVAQSAQIAGYGCGGLLLAILPPRGALAVDALSFAASGALLRWGMRSRPALAASGGSPPSGARAPGEPPRGRPVARERGSGLREVLRHRPTARILAFSWVVPACAVAPEALAAPYASAIGQPARAAGFLLMAIPAGTVVADVVVARLLGSAQQRRVILPAALLAFAPLGMFAAVPGLGPALVLLVICGLGSAWSVGIDGVLIEVAPRRLRSRALALGSAGLMFMQGAGFALWGIAGQYAPLRFVIPGAAALGAVAALALHPPVPAQLPRGAHRRPSGAYQPDGSGMPSL
jgi:MFS family permease